MCKYAHQMSVESQQLQCDETFEMKSACTDTSAIFSSDVSLYQ